MSRAPETARVKLDPSIDRRNARTQISLKAKARASQHALWTAAAAAAAGAAIASVLYLAMSDEERTGNEPDGAPRQGTEGAAPGLEALPIRTARVTVDAPTALPATTSVSARAPASEATGETQASLPLPPAPRAAAPPTKPDTPSTTPPAPPSANPPPDPKASTSKLWVEPPPRKVWVE